MLLVRKAEAGASPALAAGADGSAELRRAVESAHASTSTAGEKPQENAAASDQAGVHSDDAAPPLIEGPLQARDTAERTPDIIGSGFKLLPGQVRALLDATYQPLDAVPLPPPVTLVVRRLYHPRP